MLTFQNSFCADGRCPAERYVDRVLRLSLHRRARLLRPLLVALQHDHFEADCELVLALAGATRMSQVEAEIRDYVGDHRNANFLRGAVKMRISTRRLRSLVRSYLSAGVPRQNERV